MNPISKENVKIKNLIGIINEPTYQDLLFEIVYFLDNEKRYDGEFKVRDVALMTRVRIKKELEDDINELVKLGYVEKLKYTSYKVISHNWE